MKMYSIWLKNCDILRFKIRDEDFNEHPPLRYEPIGLLLALTYARDIPRHHP